MRRLTVALFLIGFATPAFADKIDGEWCHPDGRHIAIDGPQITTDGGHKLTGQYGRHHVSYLVPPPEARAGEEVQMVLADEFTVYRKVGPDGSTETWKRCSPTS